MPPRAGTSRGPTHFPFGLGVSALFRRSRLTGRCWLFTRVQPSRPPLALVCLRLAERGTLSPGLRTAGYPFARLGRGTWASQGLRALVTVHLRVVLLCGPCDGLT